MCIDWYDVLRLVYIYRASGYFATDHGDALLIYSVNIYGDCITTLIKPRNALEGTTF